MTESACEFGLPAAERYYRLMLAAFAALSDRPVQSASDGTLLPPGVRIYPLSLARRLVPLEQRVGRSRHIVLYRVAPDGVVEVLGLAHDRMLLGRAARRMQRETDV